MTTCSYDVAGRLYENEEIERILVRLFHLTNCMKNGGIVGQTPGSSLDLVKDIERHMGETVGDSYNSFADKFGDQLEKWKNKNVQLQQQVNKLSNDLRASIEDNKRKKRENILLKDRLQTAVDNLNDLNSEHLNDEIRRLKNRIQELEREKKDAERRAFEERNSHEEIERELFDLNESNAELQAQNEKLGDTINCWDTAASKHFKDRFCNLKKRITELKTENKRLRLALQDTERDNEEYKDTRDKALKVLQEAYTKLIEDQFNNRLKIPKLNAKQLEDIKAWYDEKLREHKDRGNRAKASIMREWDAKYRELEESLRQSEARVAHSDDEINKLRMEIAKYHILWNHFFGFDAPLKHNIGCVNAQITELEDVAGVKTLPPEENINQVIEIADLRCCNQPPLRIGEVPVNENDPQRFQLYNCTRSNIVLRNFYLQNQNGVRHSIPQRKILRSSALNYTVGRRDRKSGDLVLPDNFCSFNFNETIYLVDSHSCKIKLYPDEVEEIRELSEDIDFLEIMRVNLGNISDEWKGFEFCNVRGKPIRFMLCKFLVMGEQDEIVFEKWISDSVIPTNGGIRVILGMKGVPSQLRPNDILFQDDIQFETGYRLVMCDSFKHKIEYYVHP